MKNTLREAVLDFLRNLPKSPTDQFNKAFELYRQTPDRDQHQERVYNGGFSDSSLANLLYDLQKLHKISDVEKKLSVQETIINDEGSTDGIQALFSKLDDSQKHAFVLLSKIHKDFPDFDFSKESSLSALVMKKVAILENTDFSDDDFSKIEAILDEPEAQLFLQEKIEALEYPEDFKVAITQASITASGTSTVVSESKSDLSEDTAGEKKVIDFTPSPEAEERKRIRDEFPFLDDEDCPIELRALVTDKVTAYRKYCIAHNQLQAHQNGTAVIADEAELKNVTKLAVEEFEANRAIYDELNFYKSQGKILGVHPIFQALTLQREVNSMNKELLERFVAGAKQFMTTKKGQLTRAVNDPEKTADLNAAIDGFNQKLVLAKRKLETLQSE